MAKKTIHIIEDDPDIVEILNFNLSREGYRIQVSDDGEKALHALEKHQADLVLLDLMLPRVDGLEVCRRLKQKPHTAAIPVIMLTAKSEESDIIVGLNMGADDYVTKPFRPKELLARVKAVLRRKGGVEESEATTHPISMGALTINPIKVEVTVGDHPVALTRSEFRLLLAIASSPGRVFTRDQLLDKVCGDDVTVVDRNIDVHIAALRRKLGNAGQYIVTVHGIGYRFEES